MSVTTAEELLSSSSDWTEDEFSQVVHVRQDPDYLMKVKNFMQNPKSQELTGTHGATAQTSVSLENQGAKPKILKTDKREPLP